MARRIGSHVSDAVGKIAGTCNVLQCGKRARRNLVRNFNPGSCWSAQAKLQFVAFNAREHFSAKQRPQPQQHRSRDDCVRPKNGLASPEKLSEQLGVTLAKSRKPML